MLKKKQLIGMVCLSLLVFIGGFIGFNQLHPQILHSDADFPIISFEQLENQSHLIVKVVLIGKDSDEIRLSKENAPIDWKTFTNVRVTEVYKDTTGKLKSGDTVKVIEKYAKWRDVRGAYEIYDENYVPIRPGKEYILYLYKSNKYNAYEIHSQFQGKYLVANLNPVQLTDQELEVKEVDEKYIDKYKKVMEKYNNKT
jgi:molybdopterin converting factor small subunit